MNKTQTKKLHLFNVSIIFCLFLSIFTMFAMEYKVEYLSNELITTNKQIENYKDQIRLLEIEWVYLNRPERLRKLASKYLESNSPITISQIKKDLPNSFFVNYQKANSQQLASN